MKLQTFFISLFFLTLHFFYTNTSDFLLDTLDEQDPYIIHVLKLGGGAITVKEKQFGVARYDVISMICKEIADFLSNHPNHRIIIINGCGSFAHSIANNYELHLRLDQENIQGVVEYHNGAKKLNEILVSILNYNGVRALPIHPMSCTLCSRGRISYINTNIIRLLLKDGFVPVLHGDIVADEKVGMTILSSDQITARLGNKLNACNTGYVTIEQGVYDGNGSVIPEINEHNFNEIKQYIGGSSHTDVTGGMFAKVSELLSPHAPKISYIFHGATPGNLYKFLNNEHIGTKIVCPYY
ncbi:isopentenyl phosphate kinase family protein [bacterium]|nr:isopentenyl phosphate kinase family protein [bacterium]